MDRGEAITDPFSAPLRLRTATKLGFKNPKWITAIEVTNTYPGGYWGKHGPELVQRDVIALYCFTRVDWAILLDRRKLVWMPKARLPSFRQPASGGHQG